MEQRRLLTRVSKSIRESSGFVRIGQVCAILGIVIFLVGPICLLFGLNTIGICLLALGIVLVQVTAITYSRASYLQSLKQSKRASKEHAENSGDELAMIELALQGLENAIHSYGEGLQTHSVTAVSAEPTPSDTPERAFAGLQNAYIALSKNNLETLVISSARLISELRASMDIPAGSLNKLVSYDDDERRHLNDVRRYEQILIWVDPKTSVQSLTPFVPYAWVSPDATVLAGPTRNLVERFFSQTASGTVVKSLPTRIKEDGYLHVAFKRSLEE